jgi:hypothetical protein
MKDDLGNRLKGKVAVVVGAGQTPGGTIGNGTAIAILFPSEVAKVMLVDRRLESPIEMESMFKKRRSNYRVVINFPLEYHDMGDSCFHRAMVVNAGQRGSLIETVRDIAVDTELNGTVLFPNGFEFVNFKLLAKIVWKKPYPKRAGKDSSTEKLISTDQNLFRF